MLKPASSTLVTSFSKKYVEIPELVKWTEIEGKDLFGFKLNGILFIVVKPIMVNIAKTTKILKFDMLNKYLIAINF